MPARAPEDESNAVSDMKSILPIRSLMSKYANNMKQNLSDIDGDQAQTQQQQCVMWNAVLATERSMR